MDKLDNLRLICKLLIIRCPSLEVKPWFGMTVHADHDSKQGNLKVPGMVQPQAIVDMSRKSM